MSRRSRVPAVLAAIVLVLGVAGSTPAIAEEAREDPIRLTWALFPIIGYDPETSVNVGVKFRESDLGGGGAIFDLDVAYALLEQQHYTVLLEDPRVLDSSYSASTEASYRVDPSSEFFGIGNDSPGPEASAQHFFSEVRGSLSLGMWWTDEIRSELTFGIRDVRIARGRDEDVPSTPEEFSDLVGLDGGTIRSIHLRLVYDDRVGGLRPYTGWKVVGSVEEVGAVLANAYDYTFYSLEVSRLIALRERDYLAGVRLRVQYVEGRPQDIPFFSLPSLGGGDTLRGYFPHHFLGQGSSLVNLEARGKIVDFDFFDLWHVVIDGAVFLDSGRVFREEDEISREWHRDYRTDYGVGIRIVLSSGLLARIDVGFSSEETGLVYLSFGQVF